MNMKRFVKIALMALSAMLMVAMLAGCGSSSDGSAGQEAKAGSLTDSSPLFQDMDELIGATTYEQANDIIGNEGELLSEDDSSSIYVWDMGDDCSIQASFFASGSVRYDANYPLNLIGQRTDFSHWDEIESRVDGDGLTYDELVDLLDGVPGLLDSIRDGAYTYMWYDADNGYISAQVGAQDGEVIIVSGRF